MGNKVDYHQNAHYSIKGDTLIIKVVLDAQKVNRSPFLGDKTAFIASTIKTIPTPFGPMVVNVSVRPPP